MRRPLPPSLREHGPVVAVVALTVLGVLAYSAVADGSNASTPPEIAAPISAPAPAVAADTTAASPPTTARPSGSGGSTSSARTRPPVSAPASTPDPSGTGDPSTPGAPVEPVARTPPTVSPLPEAPELPPGVLSPLQQAVAVACTVAFTPFGLPTTVLSLVGAAIPFTLPQLPFEILITPTSDVCLALEDLVV